VLSVSRQEAGLETKQPNARRSAVEAKPVAASDVATPSPAIENATTLPHPVAKREPDELVVRAQRGDTQAFTELFRRHRSTVAAIGYRMLGPSADLDDVVQEVFLQVHRSLPDFRGQAKFSTWLHRVSVNVVLMTRRRARSRPTFAQEEAGRHEPDDGLLPDQDLSRQRRVAAFQRLLDRLSDKKRTVFVLHELEGIAPAEIAEMVDCPVLTVRTRLFYARKELAQMMRNEPALAAMSNWSGEGKVTIDDGEDESRRTSNTGHPTNGHPTNGRPTHGAKP
jgi:RNA polymerase sigma-70 factor (ECF subfamily)